MKVTALEEYGLRCMVLLARAGENAMTLPEIGAEENLSLPYAGKLLMILKQSGLVKAARGRNGGYLLARRPHEIALKDIFGALGEPMFGPNHCERYQGESDSCIHVNDCTVRSVWGTFNQFVTDYLERTTLADVALGNGHKFHTDRQPQPLKLK